MKYQIEKIEGMPDWFVPGIFCSVWNDNESPSKYKRVLVGYSDTSFGHFIDIDVNIWKYAEPIPQWEPEVGEYCAFWNSIETPNYFTIAKLYKIGEEVSSILRSGNEWGFNTGLNIYEHIARIKGVDCACSVEELKQRTDWL